MMADFDDKISSLKNVLFYARFVDDIVIISTPSLNRKLLSQHIAQLGLPSKLEFHKTGDKVFFDQIGKSPSESKSTINFDFLGYDFHIEKTESQSGELLTFKRRDVNVLIAPSKVKKIKIRILKSFVAILSSQRATEEQIKILNKRIMFLSKNYLLPSSSKEPNIYSGIYHNYSFINNYDQLKEIDSFYQNLLFGKTSRLNKRIRRTLPFKTRRGLAKHSFLNGFKNREFCRFSNSDFNEIKKAWG